MSLFFLRLMSLFFLTVTSISKYRQIEMEVDFSGKKRNEKKTYLTDFTVGCGTQLKASGISQKPLSAPYYQFSFNTGKQ